MDIPARRRHQNGEHGQIGDPAQGPEAGIFDVVLADQRPAEDGGADGQRENDRPVDQRIEQPEPRRIDRLDGDDERQHRRNRLRVQAPKFLLLDPEFRPDSTAFRLFRFEL